MGIFEEIIKVDIRHFYKKYALNFASLFSYFIFLWSFSGRKEDLVIRLSEHYESQGGAPNPEPVFVEVEGGSADGQGPDEELSNQESEEV